MDPALVQATAQMESLQATRREVTLSGQKVLVTMRRAHASPKDIEAFQRYLGTIQGALDRAIEAMGQLLIANARLCEQIAQADDDPDDATRPAFFSNIRDAWAVLRGRPRHA